MRHEWFMNGYHLGYRYDDSPIVVPDGTPAPPLEGQTYTQIARPGARAPHVWLGDGRSTLDLFGTGFRAAAARRRMRRRARASCERSRRPACRCASRRCRRRRCAQLYERALVLVRPDGHVAWRGDEEPADARALVDCVRGAGTVAVRCRAR